MINGNNLCTFVTKKICEKSKNLNIIGLKILVCEIK